MYSKQVEQAISVIRDSRLVTDDGMEEKLFLTISGLIPIVNVDLLVINDKNQILLSWRDDDIFEKGWHIPGGCLRYGESFMDRIQNTAKNEIGSMVICSEEPIAVRNVLGNAGKGNYVRERYHHVALLYKCSLKEELIIEETIDEGCYRAGELRWFEKIPDNLLKVHRVYFDILEPWL